MASGTTLAELLQPHRISMMHDGGGKPRYSSKEAKPRILSEVYLWTRNDKANDFFPIDFDLRSLIGV